MNEHRKIVIACALWTALVTVAGFNFIVVAQPADRIVANYFDQTGGTDNILNIWGTAEVESGGSVQVKSGGKINIQSGGGFELASVDLTNELAQLDGLTALSAVELNLLSGLTATSSLELNQLDGLTAMDSTELNWLDGATGLDSTEINWLDGATGLDSTEINWLDGATGLDSTEINWLDGATGLDSTEINWLDGTTGLDSTEVNWLDGTTGLDSTEVNWLDGTTGLDSTEVNWLDGVTAIDSTEINWLDGATGLDSTEINWLDGTTGLDSTEVNWLDGITAIDSTEVNQLDGLTGVSGSELNDHVYAPYTTGVQSAHTLLAGSTVACGHTVGDDTFLAGQAYRYTFGGTTAGGNAAMKVHLYIDNAEICTIEQDAAAVGQYHGQFMMYAITTSSQETSGFWAIEGNATTQACSAQDTTDFTAADVRLAVFIESTNGGDTITNEYCVLEKIKGD